MSLKRDDEVSGVEDEPPKKRQRFSSSSNTSNTSNENKSNSKTVENSNSREKKNQNMEEVDMKNNETYYDYVIIGGGVAGGYALHEFYNLQKEKMNENSNDNSNDNNNNNNNNNKKKETLCLISEESEYPYERPALSKGFLLKPNQVDLPGFNTCAFIGANHSEKWYQTDAPLKYGIFTKLNTKVTNIDFKNKEINFINTLDITSNNVKCIKYNKLLLATGTQARRMSKYDDCDNIFYLRSYKDGVSLRDSIINSKNECVKVVMIGGGYIGMEIVSALLDVFGDNNNNNKQNSKKIEIIVTFPERYFMEISMFKNKQCEALGLYYFNKFKNYNKNENISIKFINGKDEKHYVSGFDTKENKDSNNINATYVTLKDGTKIGGDYFIVGIGAKLNDELYKTENNKELLQFDERNGMPVDGDLSTKVKDVYGCGDLISYNCKFTGNPKARYEHVRHARASAMYAMRQMVGGNVNKDEKKVNSDCDNEEYTFLPQFYSRIFDCHWEFYGDLCLNEEKNDKIKVNVSLIADNGEINENTQQIIGFWTKNDAIVGVFIETGQCDDQANEKRELMQQLVRRNEKVSILGKWHALNGNNNNDSGNDKDNIEEKGCTEPQSEEKEDDDCNNIDLVIGHIRKQIAGSPIKDCKL